MSRCANGWRQNKKKRKKKTTNTTLQWEKQNEEMETEKDQASKKKKSGEKEWEWERRGTELEAEGTRDEWNVIISQYYVWKPNEVVILCKKKRQIKLVNWIQLNFGIHQMNGIHSQFVNQIWTVQNSVVIIVLMLWLM